MTKKILDPMSAAMTEEHARAMDAIRDSVMADYGENRRIEGDIGPTLTARCVNGTFVGRRSEGIIAFRGIPFVGKQPTGELRWKAPVAYEADDGVYEAYHNGKTAWQREIEPSAVYPMGEDCLYLNLWKADEASADKRPVMVWVHGGGYEIGGTYDGVYDFGNFVQENPSVIVVSVAYRLGVLGFLHLSHLKDGAGYADAQNLGLLDLRMALRWVHENIAAFGGDPDNVTIFGESAGAGAVTLLPLVDGAQAYFNRVIAESGSPALSRSREQAIACTDELLDTLGCKTVADLMRLDAEELVRAAGEVLSMRQFPERDGKILPNDTLEAYAQGAAKDIDLIIGCNKDEMNCYVSSMGVDAYLEWGDDIKRRKLAQLTDEQRSLAEGFGQDAGGDGYSHVSRLLDQMWFIAPFVRTAENQVQAGGRAYAYFFTTESTVPLMKSGHGIELYCVLNHPEMTESTGRPFDPAFCKALRQMWVNFATCGDPSLPADDASDGAEKAWPAYDSKDRYVMVFDEFDTRAVRESVVRIVDWKRTYPLTKYYVF